MTLQEYLTSLRHKTVAVIGIGVSNTPLLRRLLAEGIAVTACDRSSREKLGPLADELEATGATLHLGEGYLDGLTQDVIFRTPGLRPDVPQLLTAQRQGSTLTSEMEVFFQVCPCHMIAVTGSDGKTTTTTIIAELLKAAGRTVHVGGNIGQPLLCQADDMEPEDWAVLELYRAQSGSEKKILRPRASACSCSCVSGRPSPVGHGIGKSIRVRSTRTASRSAPQRPVHASSRPRRSPPESAVPTTTAARSTSDAYTSDTSSRRPAVSSARSSAPASGKQRRSRGAAAVSTVPRKLRCTQSCAIVRAVSSASAPAPPASSTASSPPRSVGGSPRVSSRPCTVSVEAAWAM